MRHETEFPRKVIEIPDMGITLSDGCRLSARVWMPEDASDDPVPAVLEHLPYRKRDGTIVRDQFSHPWMAGQGYACIRTDMRGNGESEGLMDDEYTQQELDDASEVIAWIAAQDWCNGNVGMQGISWGGFNSLQVAAMAPPALKAIITICSTTDRYADDIHYKGGSLLVENFGWSANMTSYSSRPPDPALVGEGWTDIWRERLEAEPLNWDKWHAHQHRDDYWKHGSVCEDYSAIKAAVLSVGGWHDGYRNTISHLVENLDAPVKGIVGPWNHKYPHYAGPKPAIGFLQESQRWWDHWLKGIDRDVENDPDYRAYLMDSMKPKRWFDKREGRWIAETSWPSDNIARQRLHLVDGGLSAQKGAAKGQISSPQNCGTGCGEYFPFAFSDELPDEQSADDAMSLCFDGDITTEATDIVGAPEVALTLSSDQPNAQVVVRLTDLRPDGTSAFITYGIFNLTHHQSHETPSALVAGQDYTVRFALDQIAYHLPKGHRLRVSLSNGYWPMIWPSPQKTILTLSKGAIDIPVRPSTNNGDEVSFEEPVGAPAWRAEELRAASYSRETATDAQTGIVSVLVHADSGENRDLEHGLISGSWNKLGYYIHPDDPLSARATAEWEQTGGREGQMWRTHLWAEMTCDAKQFHVKKTLKTFLNGKLFFEKDYAASQDRKLV